MWIPREWGWEVVRCANTQHCPAGGGRAWRRDRKRQCLRRQATAAPTAVFELAAAGSFSLPRSVQSSRSMAVGRSLAFGVDVCGYSSLSSVGVAFSVGRGPLVPFPINWHDRSSACQPDSCAALVSSG